MSLKRITLAALLLAAAATPALAHTGHGEASSFATGFLHPLGGLDHVLAMVAVGLYAAQLGGRNLWLVPLAFVAAMVGAGALGYAGFALPAVEQGIGLSIIVMGLAIALGIKLPTFAAMTLVAVFAAFHGHAHGAEGADVESFLPYAAGFVLATSLLHLAGVALGLGLDRLGEIPSGVTKRAAGAAGALAGVSIMSGWL